MSLPGPDDGGRELELARQSVSNELPPGGALPDDEVDLVKTGLIDSMGWVGVLLAIEEDAGIRDFGNPWPEGRPQSIRGLADLVRASRRQGAQERPKGVHLPEAASGLTVSIKGWGYALGALTVEAEQVERELGLQPHTIRDRAGIQAVRRAGEHEDEISLAQKAAEEALEIAKLDIERVDLLVAVSTTFLGLPALASTLHSRLLLPEATGALDVGGACAGFIYALEVAKSFLQSNAPKVALVVASEVNSRRLASPGVPGEFRGLFGDGACACVLARPNGAGDAAGFKLGNLAWGCSGAFASSLRAGLTESNAVDVQFKGEQLAQAAVAQLERVVVALEELSGTPRNEVDRFCLHEPNPRVIEILAEKARIPLERIPLVSRNYGNLGSATCGISLCKALTDLEKRERPSPRALIFLAAVAPGLIWGGNFLST